MKKLVLILSIGLIISFSLNSCKAKCGTCSKQNGITYQGEYCQGNNLEDAYYEAAKADCENRGGTFDQ